MVVLINLSKIPPLEVAVAPLQKIGANKVPKRYIMALKCKKKIWSNYQVISISINLLLYNIHTVYTYVLDILKS